MPGISGVSEPIAVAKVTMAGRKLRKGIAEWWTGQGLGLGCVLDIPLPSSNYTEITLLSLLRKVFLNLELRYLSLGSKRNNKHYIQGVEW